MPFALVSSAPKSYGPCTDITEYAKEHAYTTMTEHVPTTLKPTI